MLAGSDSVAIDAAAAKMMGLSQAFRVEAIGVLRSNRLRRMLGKT